MKWTSKGPALSDGDIRHFESKTGYPLPEPMVWFLSNIANGGRPVPLVDIPFSGEEGDILFTLNGLYGINHPDGTYDFWRPFEVFPERTANGIPVGFDGGSGQVMYVLHGPHAGQVRQMPWDEYADPRCTDTYFVATSMREFAQLIESCWREQTHSTAESSRPRSEI